MFTLSRVINCIYTLMVAIGFLLVLMVAGMPDVGWGVTLSAIVPITLCVCDLIFRQQSSPNNKHFAGVWVLWFLFAFISAVYGFITTTSTGLLSPMPGVTGPQFLALVMFIAIGIPFLANLIYFLKLSAPNRASPTA